MTVYHPCALFCFGIILRNAVGPAARHNPCCVQQHAYIRSNMNNNVCVGFALLMAGKEKIHGEGDAAVGEHLERGRHFPVAGKAEVGEVAIVEDQRTGVAA